MFFPVDMHPHVRFAISYRKDVETFFAFLKDSKYDKGQSFQFAVLSKYPELEKFVSKENFSADRKSVEKFVKDSYLKNKSAVEQNLRIYKKNWGQIADQFFPLVGQLFPSTTWPKGKYIAYPTMWGMFPRFLDDKTFQIPFTYPQEKYINAVIAHEMIHFIFYEYFFSKWPQYKTNPSAAEDWSFFVWNVSEIFNTVVQNSPKWMKIFKIKSKGYPEQRTIVKELQKKYYTKENWTTDELISDIIKAVKDGA